MKFLNELRKCSRSVFSAGAIWVALALAPAGLSGQSLPAIPQAPPKPATKVKRVWTEDDLIALRRPWDRYQIEQEKKAEEERAAREAAEAAKKAPAAKESGEATAREAEPAAPPAAAANLPEIVPAIGMRLAEARRRAFELEQKFQAAERALYDSGEEERAEALKRRNAAEQELLKAREEVRLLEEKLRALKSDESNTPPSP